MLKAFSFYKSCMNESEIEAAGTKAMLEVIEKYGSWGITNKNWTGDSWTLEKILARVLADLRVSPFINVRGTPSPLNSSQVVVQVSAKEKAIAGYFRVVSLAALGWTSGWATEDGLIRYVSKLVYPMTFDQSFYFLKTFLSWCVQRDGLASHISDILQLSSRAKS